MIEKWFTEITRKRIRRVFLKNVLELVAAITEYIKVNNENSKPFVWTKTVEKNLEKVYLFKAVTEKL